jgi:hypothetical protein
VSRGELPQFVDSLLAVWRNRITATRWGATADGVLIEWVATGNGARLALAGWPDGSS